MQTIQRADYNHLMAHAPATELVPGLPLRFPVAVRPPRGFKPEKPETWPALEGRLEFHDGRLLYMPPCADEQADVVFSVTQVLGPWLKKNRAFVGSTNEAGMILAGSVRAADAALWRRADLADQVRGTLRRVPPVLAVEVGGQDEDEAALREKATWYLDRGVRIVWLILPKGRQVVVLTTNGSTKHTSGERLAATPVLPGLAPAVKDFFEQLND